MSFLSRIQKALEVLGVYSKIEEVRALALSRKGGGGASSGGASIWGQITGILSNQTDLQTALNSKASTSELNDHISDTSNPHSVTKTQVGLGNVPDLDTTDAVNNQHTHSNKSLLDTYAQTETDLADAVSKKHDALTIGTNTASALSLSGQELSLGDVFVQGINTNKITVSATEPSSPNTGDIWIDTGA